MKRKIEDEKSCMKAYNKIKKNIKEKNWEIFDKVMKFISLYLKRDAQTERQGAKLLADMLITSIFNNPKTEDPVKLAKYLDNMSLCLVKLAKFWR